MSPAVSAGMFSPRMLCFALYYFSLLFVFALFFDFLLFALLFLSAPEDSDDDDDYSSDGEDSDSESSEWSENDGGNPPSLADVVGYFAAKMLLQLVRGIDQTVGKPYQPYLIRKQTHTHTHTHTNKTKFGFQIFPTNRRNKP